MPDGAFAVPDFRIESPPTAPPLNRGSARDTKGYCGAHSGHGTPFLTQIGLAVQPAQQCVFGEQCLVSHVPPAKVGWIV